MLEHFVIGWKVENALKKFKKSVPNRKIILQGLKILGNSTKVLSATGSIFDKDLTPYYSIFSDSMNEETLELTYASIFTLKRAELSKQIGNKELKDTQNFLEKIVKNCISLQKREYIPNCSLN